MRELERLRALLGLPRIARARAQERQAGKRYPVEILYDAETTHPTTDQGIRLEWATPRGTWPGAFTPIPVSQLNANP